MMVVSRLFFPYAASFGTGVSILYSIYLWFVSDDGEEDKTVNDDVQMIFVLSCQVYLLYAILRYARNVSKLQFPGPTPIPLLGNSLSLIDKANVQESIRHLSSTYGKVIDILLLDGDRVLLVNDASFSKIVMKSMDRGDLLYNHDSSNNNTIKDTFKESWWKLVPKFLWSHRRYREQLVWKDLWGDYYLDLFTRSDKYGNWKDHRRLLQPAFDQKHVRAMRRKIQASVENLVSSLPEGTTVDVMPYLLDYGLDMIHSTSLGKSLSDLPDRGKFVVRFLTNATKLFSQYMFDPFPYFSSQILPLIGLNKRETQRRKELPAFRQYCRDLIEKEQQKEQAKNAVAASGENDSDGVDNLLSLMVDRLSNEFKVENAIDELVAFIFAGYETTATTLGNLIYDLASNPTAQKKVHEELDDAFKNNSQSPYDNIIQNQLPYLSACIRESQRLQPVAPLLGRRLHKDTPLQYTDSNGVQQDTTIRKDTTVWVPIFLLQHDENEYIYPETFRPERWLTNDGVDGGDDNQRLIPPTPGYFFAFGGGPKMCVGFQLAEIVVKMAAAGIFSSYAVYSQGERVIVDSFTTGPEKVLCELKPRKKMATS